MRYHLSRYFLRNHHDIICDNYLRYRAISCDISRDGVCQNYPGYLAIISRDKDIAKYPTS